jgi:hypothetical protein
MDFVVVVVNHFAIWVRRGGSFASGGDRWGKCNGEEDALRFGLDNCQKPGAGSGGSSYPLIVTSDLVVHKDQILCKRYCKLGRRTLYSGHQQQRGSPYYKSQYEHG